MRFVKSEFSSSQVIVYLVLLGGFRVPGTNMVSRLWVMQMRYAGTTFKVI